MDIQQEYLQKFKNIMFYFTQMTEEQTSKIEIDNNFINVKGKETFLNILEKTVESMKYVYANHEFDYLIRTNISTIININKLWEFLTNVPEEKYYGCSWYLTLNWLDHRAGIVDSTYFGTQYAQGTNIIFSKDIVKSICENSDSLHYEILDDVALGIYINKYHPEAIKISINYQPTILFTEINDIILDDYIFYRNRRNENTAEENRENDIQTMLCLTNLLGWE